MNICDHIIKDQEIIGIGPLMMEQHPDVTIRALYGRRQLSFELHLSAHTIQIKSNWYDARGQVTDTLEADKNMANRFRNDYHEARKKVLEQIGEIETKS